MSVERKSLLLTLGGQSNPQDIGSPVRAVNGPIWQALACQCIDRAILGMGPGGVLEICLALGEPLLEPEWIEKVIDHARAVAATAGIKLELTCR